MNRKIIGLTVGALLFALSSPVAAQQPAKIPRIGYRGLRELGYTEGKDIVIEYRGAEGKFETIPSIVTELVRLQVDVLVLPLFSAIEAAKNATRTIPIVMITQVDPVAAGLVASLARPGGNITGLATLQRDLSGKRLELLTDVVPRLSRVGILRRANEKVSNIGFKEYAAAAQALKIKLQSLEVNDPHPDLEGAFQAALKAHANGLITITSNPLFSNAKRVTDLAIRNRLPSMCEGSSWVDNGGLMSYSANDLEVFRRAATYVDKILKGAKPADLPVEQPTKFEFLVNLKTAKQIGLTIPPNVLARADRVIR